MTSPRAPDPAYDWLAHMGQVGLVVAPSILSRHGLVPERQTVQDTAEAAELLNPEPHGPALSDAWAFLHRVLGWKPGQVAGSPGGPPVPEDLVRRLPEGDTVLAPTLAVAEPPGARAAADGPAEARCQLLVRIEARGVDPDRRGALPGWEATPHQRFERLLRETGVPAGLLLTDRELRLVHAPRGETSGWLPVPLRALGTVAGRPMLGGLKLLLSHFRLFNDAPVRRLPALLRDSRDSQAEVSSKLAHQVLGALHELLRGLHAAEPDAIALLARQRPDHLYEGLLAVLLRLVFLLYAEDRDLIPSRTDAESRALYDQGYGVRRLHARLLDDEARNPDTMDERRGAWGGLLALFRLVHQGDGAGWVRGRGGKLFDPAAFPFLTGQFAQGEPSRDPLRVPTVTDGCVLRVLDKLLVLDGERLSYRRLDVEQIGSVYETVMGFAVAAFPGPALAIKAGKNDRTPVFVDLRALAAVRGADRAKWLKEEAGRDGKLKATVAGALAAARDDAEIAAALLPIADERGSPGGLVHQPGTPLLQPTDERRRTGSHYTPRTLTEPIVRYALEPAFERIGGEALPGAVLALKVCDPAMGSGAFLVEACRQLAARLVTAWGVHPELRPPVPADEDEELFARRLVAQRCLYGVDRNPMATDLARLSLWLATLARDHEFTFLDHALKSGDSLVGLTRAQLGALRWDAEPAQGTLFGGLVRGRLEEAARGRTEIQGAPDDVERAIQEARHAQLEGRIEDVRTLGDAVVATFFGADKPRKREQARLALEGAAAGSPERAWPALRARAAELRAGPHPIRPFHWEAEFPEVFGADPRADPERAANPGFDAIVSNPPFLSGSRTSQENGATYFEYLLKSFSGARHQCDYVAFFVRKSFALLRSGGAVGLICTKTAAQGDTRESGFEQILRSGASIYRVVRRIVWPLEAAVIVAFVHFAKDKSRTASIDGMTVHRISAYLVEGDLDTSPARLASSPYFSKGSQPYGQGFVFDDADSRANTIATREALARDPQQNMYIHPMYGGTDLNKAPVLHPAKWIIDVSILAEEKEFACLPELDAIIRGKVKPERDQLPENSNNRPLKRRWWAYQAHRPELYRRMRDKKRFLAHAEVSPYLAFRFVECGPIYIKTAILFDLDENGSFGVCQSRVHEVWVRSFASSMKDDLRYTPSDCFQTYPFPTAYADDHALDTTGTAYHDSRAAVMRAHGEGLTKLYNRFHDPAHRSPDIARLRELHHAMDQVVLRAYGWDDLANRAAPEFLTAATEPDHRYQGRLFWPAPFRDEVLARLLALNAERAEDERRMGLTPAAAPDDAETELEDA